MADISPDVVILTRRELRAMEVGWYNRGVRRGQFEPPPAGTQPKTLADQQRGVLVKVEDALVAAQQWHRNCERACLEAGTPSGDAEAQSHADQAELLHDAWQALTF